MTLKQSRKAMEKAIADALCTECGKREAVTRDGRKLCLYCLRRAIAHDTPMIGCYKKQRTADQREESAEDSGPSGENAVKVWEDAS